MFEKITNVEILNFHTSGSLSFHSAIRNACSCGVVAMDSSRGLQVD